MREVHVTRVIPAPPSAVWKVLADFPNIADWNTGVKTSYATGPVEGVGAKRHCDLAPMGELEETVAEWEVDEKMVVSIDSTKKMPIKHGRATFTLGDAGDSTDMSLRYEYDTRWGPIGRLMGGSLDRQLTKGFTGFLADLDTAATAGASA